MRHSGESGGGGFGGFGGGCFSALGGGGRGVTLVHFSPQPEPFFIHQTTQTTQRIPQIMLTLSRKVDGV